jgi:predicted extracellular nuclease
LSIIQQELLAVNTSVFINEFHYDNDSTDVGEFIEIAGPAGTDLTGWSLVLYNGSSTVRAPYDTDFLSGSIPDLGNGFGTVVLNYPTDGIQNGAPDGIALVDNNGSVVQFLSYEGTFEAASGPAAGLTSTDIGVSETSSTPVGFSLQLSGTGSVYEDFTWSSPTPATSTAVNDGQTFTGGGSSGSNLVINEIIASHTGTDNTEFVELYGTPGTALAGLSLIAVESEASGNGTIDQRIDFGAGDVIGENGFFLLGNPEGLFFNYGVEPNLNIGPDSFENSSATYALVETASLVGGIGTLVTGSEVVIDAVAATDGGAGDSFFFNAPVVGPDGTFFPAGVRRVSDGVDTDTAADWVIGNFGLSNDNTPTPGTAGSDGGDGGTATDLFFSEYVEGSSFNKAVEIANLTGAEVDLSTYSLEIYFNGSSSPGTVIPLAGTVANGDVYVIADDGADSAILNVADLTSGSSFFNGDDAVVLRKGEAVVDAIGQVGTDPGSQWGSGDVSTQDNTIRRKAGITAGDTNPDDPFDPSVEWDGFPSNTFDGLGRVDGNNGGDDGPDLGNFGDAATLISTIQGEGLASGLVNQQVVIEGVVVGDFQPGLDGFYVQEEASDSDGNGLTSEGIFVYAPGAVDVKAGDKVRVAGTVDEFFDQTQIDTVTGILVDDSQSYLADVASTPVVVENTADALERYEGMLVTFPETLTVTENFDLGRFGEAVLSSSGLQFQGTQVAAPGADALAVAAANQLNRIILDDSNSSQNPDPVAYPGFELSADNSLRSGATVTDLTGVLSYTFGEYKVQPTVAPNFVDAAPRTATPDPVGGDLKVASFNVLNYFTTLNSRGADNAEEFDRQEAKIVSAINSLDADVVGLIEIENNGYGPDGAISTLVDALNEAAGAGTWAYIDPGLDQLGDDQIAVGFIYKPGSVTPIGDAAALTTGAFEFGNPNNLEASRNRVPLAQSFQQNGSGDTFTAVVNHFKSKGDSGLNDPNNPNFDQGDGQGFWNAVRTKAAAELAAWLETDPTGVGDPDYLILGDLNAYAMEDPIMALQAAGYTDLANSLETQTDAASYVFFGEFGTLDYALSNQPLTAQVTGVDTWQINSREPRVLDYNTEFKSPGQVVSFFNDQPYRSSDHDPVLVGLDLLQEVRGTEGRDRLTGSNNNLQLLGFGGNDTIAGGLGNDQIFGGAGNDVLRGDGNDRRSNAGGPAGGDDYIDGGAGNDRIGGKAGNDILLGGAGNDQLWGDDGDDLLRGGLGDDILTGDDFSGGQGSDTFVLALGEGTDTVVDFEVGIDVIGLAGGLGVGDLSVSQSGADTLVTAGDATLKLLNLTVGLSDLTFTAV